MRRSRSRDLVAPLPVIHNDRPEPLNRDPCAQVGFEFEIDKTRLRQYGRDYLVAMTAASFPWVFVAFYFMYALGDEHNVPWKEALVAARFAAPTSAGILFTMLEAAGMSETWLFKKASSHA